jgi:hypothetical protein
MTKRTITIEFIPGKTFDVKEEGSSTGDLAWDEMLAAIAELTHPKIGTPRVGMFTDEEWEKRRKRFEDDSAT